MSHKKILNYLYSLEAKKFRRNLKNMKLLLKKIGSPEKKLKFIHVTGTNGKGSVCAMLFSVLREAGFKVGMYTSPHLKRFNERIQIGSKLITNNEIVEYYLKLKPFLTNQTFFEITTAMAFLYFYEKKADYVVLEVGLGGRLDTTNVVKPLASVITNVDIEHTEYLGNTIEEIAHEKAGIIKKNTPAATGAEGKALKVIKSIAKQRHAPLSINEKYKKNKDGAFDIGNYKNLKLNFLKGGFQLQNTSIAIAAINILNKYCSLNISENNVKNGLKKAKWPGRFQFLKKNVLIDCAHNPNGFKALTEEVKKLNYNKLILVIGISNDKDIKKMIEIINPLADRFIITKAQHPKAAEPELISKYLKKEFKIINNPKKALDFAKKTANMEDLILVAGSIFVVGEILGK